MYANQALKRRKKVSYLQMSSKVVSRLNNSCYGALHLETDTGLKPCAAHRATYTAVRCTLKPILV